MTSVHSTAHGFNHRFPALNQAFKLQSLPLVKLRDFFQFCDLLEHQWQITERPLSRPRHIGVAHQGVSAENDALVGFGWGHGGISRQLDAFVNGEAAWSR